MSICFPGTNRERGASNKNSRLQPLHACRGAAAELIDLHTHALGEGNEEVGEGGVVFLVVGDVALMFEAASRDEDGQVAPVVAARVAEVRAVEHGGVV